jgi:uncharacterized protein YbcI
MHEVAAPPGMGGRLAKISTEIVSLHKDFYGRGPTEAKTYAVNDTIVCLLKGGFTEIEKSLIADHKNSEVEDLRRSFQQTMGQQFTTVVEEALGRKVIGYLSQIHIDPDVAVEIFLLEPGEELLGAHHHGGDAGGAPGG